MNCYLPWNLRDMTNISAEKLQRNMDQQATYLDMYHNELVKEAYRFNIASILKYASLHKASLGNDPFSKLASDCLIVFLHACALKKQAFFTPSDSENSVHVKGCKNLHRLMMENVKATMRYIDYSVLLKRALGQTNVDGMYALRDELYSKVFPEETLLDVCSREKINDAFFSIVDCENSGHSSFMGYDVQNICNLDSFLCDLLSTSCCSQEDFEKKQYGILESAMESLQTPFIRRANRYYSFVTRFSLKQIHDKLEGLYPEEETAPEVEAESADVVEPEVEVETAEEVEPEVEAEPADEVEPTEAVAPEVETEVETAEEVTPEENYDEEFPPEDFDEEYEEEYEASDVEPNVIETEEELEDDVPADDYDETTESENDSVDDLPWDEDGDDSDEDYSYLKDVSPKEFTKDPLVEDQEDSDLYEEDDLLEEESTETSAEEVEEDEEDPYSGSLFDDIDSDEPEVEAEQTPESVPEPVVEPEPAVENEPTSELEPEPVEEPAPEPEPVPEPQPEVEAEPEPEPQPAPVEVPEVDPTPEPEPEPAPELPLTLLDTVIKGFTRENAVTQYVAQLDAEQRKSLSNLMESALKACVKDGKDKLFAIPDTAISVMVYKASRDPMLGMQRRQYVGAMMYADGRDSWSSLELSINDNGALVKSEYEKITKSSFLDWQWKLVENLGKRILERRK